MSAIVVDEGRSSDSDKISRLREENPWCPQVEKRYRIDTFAVRLWPYFVAWCPVCYWVSEKCSSESEAAHHDHPTHGWSKELLEAIRDGDVVAGEIEENALTLY